MEFKEVIKKRRSIRKFLDRAVPQEVVERILHEALSAPSSRNSRSTHLMVVDKPNLLAEIAQMRDYGSAFVKNAPLAVVVLGDPAQSDLWRENGAITATLLLLAAVDEGLGACWVQVNGRPHRKEEPQGESAADYLRSQLPIPEGLSPLCVVALGYTDFTPAPLPQTDDNDRVIRID